MKRFTMTIEEIQTQVRVFVALIAGLALVAVATLSIVLATAGGAEAAWVSKTRAGEHRPKSFVCKVFNICKTDSHYYCGDPTKAYTNPPPCRFLHYDRY